MSTKAIIKPSYTARVIADLVKQLGSHPHIKNGTVFNILVVVDAIGKALPVIVKELDEAITGAEGWLRINVLTASRLDVDFVRGMTVVAFINQSSYDPYSNEDVGKSLDNSLLTAAVALDLDVADLRY